MPYLREISDCRQIPGEPARRWFSSERMDLVVWVSETGAPVGFQLCYDKPYGEKAVTLRPGATRPQYMAVDTGEFSVMRHKASPILVPDGAIDAGIIVHLFRQEAGQIPQEIVHFVTSALSQTL